MCKTMKNECLCHVYDKFITFSIALITAFQLSMILYESRIIESLNACRQGLQNKDKVVALNWFERETKNYAHCLGQEIRETAAE